MLRARKQSWMNPSHRTAFQTRRLSLFFFFSTKSIDNSAPTLTTVHWQFDFDAFGKPWIKFASNSLTDFGKPLYILFGWSMAYAYWRTCPLNCCEHFLFLIKIKYENQVVNYRNPFVPETVIVPSSIGPLYLL